MVGVTLWMRLPWWMNEATTMDEWYWEEAPDIPQCHYNNSVFHDMIAPPCVKYEGVGVRVSLVATTANGKTCVRILWAAEGLHFLHQCMQDICTTQHSYKCSQCRTCVWGTLSAISGWFQSSSPWSASIGWEDEIWLLCSTYIPRLFLVRGNEPGRRLGRM